MLQGARTRHWISLTSLLLTNACILLAVLFGKISLLEVLVVYWAESAVIGVFTVLKILLARPAKRGANDKVFVRLFMAAFFCVHFGGFMFVHLMFFGFVLIDVSFDVDATPRYLYELAFLLGGLFVSHAVSFVVHFLRGGEREAHGPSAWFFRPYVRIMVMQLTLILGGGLVLLTGSGFAIVALLVALKTVVDGMAHWREHRERALAEFSESVSRP